jgi:hypothetical protein
MIVPNFITKQCAADRTSFLEMSVPPQKDLWKFSIFLFVDFLFMMATWKGNENFGALLPSEILALILGEEQQSEKILFIIEN